MEDSLPFLVYFAQNFGSASLDEFEDLAEFEGLPRSLDLLGRRKQARKQTRASLPASIYSAVNEDDDLLAWNIETSQVEDSPMHIVHLPPSSAERICTRSVLIKGMWELYGYGYDVHSCATDVEKRRRSIMTPSEDDIMFENSSAVGEERVRIYSTMKRRRELISSPLMSWRFLVESYGVSISLSAQEGIRRHFEHCLSAEGPVKLRESECNVTYCAILDFGVAHLQQKKLESPANTRQTTDVLLEPLLEFDPLFCDKAHFYCKNTQMSPSIENDDIVSQSSSSSNNRRPTRRVYFGKQVGTTKRHLIGDLSLKNRPYLGPTSLDPELALIMANLGRSYKPGALVWDPFVGTGSVSVAVASLGGLPVGTEIDARVLRGKLSRSAATNFKQYGLSAPEQVRMDATRHAFRDCINDGVKKDDEDSGIFDAIITDPPYGIRAGSNRPGVNEMSREEWRASQMERSGIDNTRIGSTDEKLNSSMDKEDMDINEELLELAARMLVPGGRLVFLLPAAIDASREQLPFHPLLRRIYSSVEQLSFALSRLVITMEKISTYNPHDPSLRSTYLAACKSRTEALLSSGVSIGVGSRAMQRVGYLMDEWFEVQQNKKEKNDLPESMTSNPSMNKKRSAMKRLARQQHRFEKLSAEVKKEDCKVESRPCETSETSDGSKLTKKERAIVRAREAHASGKKVHIGNVPFDLSQWQEEELKEKLGLKEEPQKHHTTTSSHSLIYLFIARYFASNLGPGVSVNLNTRERFMYRDAVNGAHSEIQVSNDSSGLSFTMRAISSGDRLSVFIASNSVNPEAVSRSSSMCIEHVKNTHCSEDVVNHFIHAIEARTSEFQTLIMSPALFVDFITPEQLSLTETRVTLCVRDVRRDRNDGRIFPCLLGIPDDLFIEIMCFAGKDGCSRLRATCKTARDQMKNKILHKKIQRLQE